MRRATLPFQFSTASYVTRIDNQMATTIGQLREGLQRCSDRSIFYHTFQSLGRHHFLTEGFSNDFAQWVLAGLNRPGLAEHLAALDIRSYVDLGDLRTDCLGVVDAYCQLHSDEIERRAFEPFHFCSSFEVLAPLGHEAWTLAEFREGLEQAGHGSLHLHFLVSRLRLHLQSNDFSVWFAEELGLETLARLANRIDVCTNTLDGVRARLLALIDREPAA